MGAPLDGPNPTPSGAPAPLVGPPAQADPAAPLPMGPTPEQEQAAFMAEVREITIRISSLARSFPAGAEDFELAVQNVINGMTKTVISQSNTEPMSAPNLVG